MSPNVGSMRAMLSAFQILRPMQLSLVSAEHLFLVSIVFFCVCTYIVFLYIIHCERSVGWLSANDAIDL